MIAPAAVLIYMFLSVNREPQKEPPGQYNFIQTGVVRVPASPCLGRRSAAPTCNEGATSFLEVCPEPPFVDVILVDGRTLRVSRTDGTIKELSQEDPGEKP